MNRRPMMLAAMFIALVMILPAAVSAVILDPNDIPKYVAPLVIPPEMPQAGKMKGVDYYEIEVVQFDQQILPEEDIHGGALNMTKVWSYGALGKPETRNYPAFTIEAMVNRPTRVKWINNLMDADGNYLPHLLPVDQTLHWANPPQDCISGPSRTDCRGQSQDPYDGPVPIITHVHGAHVGPESDGYPEAWYLPDADNIPAGYATQGTRYDQYDTTNTDPGTAVFQYPNTQDATTLWYHDHTLGMTRTNVYAGPAGFYLLRGNGRDFGKGLLPGPAPSLKDKPGTMYYEIPIVIQDRSFNTDGSLFYPDNRAFFEGLDPLDLQIPFIPDEVDYGSGPVGTSDVSPIWNPEFFGNVMVVNGKTWPYLNVEQRRYRLRFLNGSDSRFLILKMDNPAINFWQVGSDGGFLPEVVNLSELLMGPAERADVIVDFSGLKVGDEVILQNIGPDEPFGGGIPGVDFDAADPATTGQVMKFVVVAPGPNSMPDSSVNPMYIRLPRLKPLPEASVTRQLSLNELESGVVNVSEENGSIVLDENGEPFGPTAALLGTYDPDTGTAYPQMWENLITENPALGATEMWEIHNFTMDAHPIHLHLVQFEIVERQAFGDEKVSSPEPWEMGLKDTVIAYPGATTRVKATFDIPGLFVWHCHILEHEDNEMMRPYCVGDRDTYCPGL